MPKEGI
ncbi:uncharacterized protein FFNC_06487 [Fusarium fujikuroi]|nr:uncharacterized protein FFNC_06487 [Fusarium fujikuroi]